MTTITGLENMRDMASSLRFELQLSDHRLAAMTSAEIAQIPMDDRMPLVEDAYLNMIVRRYVLGARSLRAWFYETSCGVVQQTLIDNPRKMDVRIEHANHLGEMRPYFSATLDHPRLISMAGDASTTRPLVIGFEFPIAHADWVVRTGHRVVARA